jgi:PKD repeat protein
MKHFLLLAGLLAVQSLSAQHEFDNWYFGQNAGVSFVSGSPVNLSGGQISTNEGCSSISDGAGNLLFYTDGQTVYDKNHTLMPNGTGLLGNWSSTQSALIVSDPGNVNQYYIFTTDGFVGTNGLRYSIVDMTLNGGNGDIGAVKNVQLMNVCDEKVTGIRNSAGNGFWILSHENSAISNSWYAFPLTAAGVGAPVVSSVGPLFPGGVSFIGYLKISPAGNYLARAMYDSYAGEIAEFDNANGMVSNPSTYNAPAQDVIYGVEFSASGNVLYMMSGDIQPSKLFQFDMTAGNTAAIVATGTVLDDDNTQRSGAIQIASDNKIYVSHSGTQSLGVINDPEILGLGCNYVRNGFTLNTTTNIGLPNAISGLTPLPPIALFTSPNHLCPGTCTDFTDHSQHATSWIWTFSGANPSVSTDQNPTGICYNAPGTYAVSLIVTNAVGSDTLTLNNYITIYPYPAPQGIMQNGDTLFANTGALSYQWYHDGVLIQGATEYYYIAPEGGNYNVVATDNNGCEVEAVIFDVVAGIDQLAVANGQLAIYPVPVKDYLNIHSEALKGKNIQLSVYNMLGEIVIESFEVKVAADGICIADVSTLADGNYHIRIKAGENFLYGKFMKK